MMKKVVNIGMVWIGIIFLILSAMQQLLVNYLPATAVITMVVSVLLAYTNKSNKKIWIPLCVIAAVNILGVLINRYTMLEILGIISFATGIVFVVAGLIQKFKAQKRMVTNVLAIIGSVLVVFASGFLNFTALRPDITMVMMGNSVSPVLNVTDAQQSERTLEDGTRLISDVCYDTQLPNGYLDIYHTTKGENAPTLIFIHGGGYLWGDKASGDPNAENTNFSNSTGGRFLAEGYNVVQMNYALAPDYPFPAAIKQLNRGLDFLVKNGDKYGLDMERVVIGGGSAGGNLAGTLINIQTNAEYAKVVGETAVIDASCIKAGVFEGGLFDNSRFGKTGSVMVDWSFTQLGRAYLGINELAANKKVVTPSNVLDYVTASFPASFISDGNTGTFNDQAEDMHTLLDGFGVPNELCIFPKEEASLAHGFEESGSEYADRVFERMFAFLNENME